MREGRYEIGSIFRGHSAYRRVEEGVTKEVAFEQGFIGQGGFLKTNIRSRRKSDGQFSAETFQTVEKPRAKR